MKKTIPGELILLATAIIWGYGFIAVAQSLDEMSPFQVLFYRFTIASLFLGLFFFRRFKTMGRQTLLHGLILGLIFFIGFAFQTVGMKYTTPSKNAFLTAVNVILVPIIALGLFRRRLRLNELMGALLALVGIGLLTLRQTGPINPGDLLTLCCALAFAFHIIYTSRFLKNSHPIDLTIIQTLTCMILSGLASLWEGSLWQIPSTSSLWALFFLGFFSTCLASLMQSYGQKTTSETRAAIFLSTESLWGSFFSYLFLGEVLGTKGILGGLLIFIAVLIAELPKARAVQS